MTAITVSDFSSGNADDFELLMDSFPNAVSIEIYNFPNKKIDIKCSHPNKISRLVVRSCPDLDLHRLVKELAFWGNISELVFEDNGSLRSEYGIARLKNLRKLSILSYDLIDSKKLFTEISDCPSLQELEVSNSNWDNQSIYVSFPDGLKKLVLSGNGLLELPAGIEKIDTLTLLDISGNNRGLIRYIEWLENVRIGKLVVDCFSKRDSAYISRRVSCDNLSLCIPQDDEVVKRQSRFSNQNKNDTPKMTYRSFSPLSYDTDIPYQTTTLNAGQNQTFTATDGSIVSIPGGALIDKDGNTVVGEYTLVFRPLNDPVSIALSGVPLEYDSAGITNVFTTAGMFEVYAYKGEEQLNIRPGASINVNLVSEVPSAGFNTYYYNDSVSNWEYEGEGSAVQSLTRELVRSYSNAYQLYPRLNFFPFDTRGFTDRVENTNYIRTRPVILNSRGRIANECNWFRLKTVKVKGCKGKILLEIPYRSDRNILSEFRESLVYRSCLWNYTGGLSRREFVRTYILKKKYTGLRFFYDGSGTGFTLELKTSEGFVEIPVQPVRRNTGELSDNAEQLCSRMDARYNKTVLRYSQRLDKEIDDMKRSHTRRIWREINRRMSDSEKSMSREEWCAYAKEMCDQEKRSLDSLGYTVEYFTRSLSLNSFGLCNIDKILLMTNTIAVNADFYYNGRIIRPVGVQVVDFTVNTVYTAQTTPDFSRLVFNPENLTGLCLTSDNQDVFVVGDAGMNLRMSGNSKAKIECKRVDYPTVGNVKEAMGVE